MSSHWSQPFVEFLRTVVPEINKTPLYVLRVNESAADWNPTWLACCSCIGDLKAKPDLEALGLWAGRGVSITVRDDFETWSPRCQAGVLLHELAHGIEQHDYPESICPMADLSPLAREVLEGNESEILATAGIERDGLLRKQHGETFIRLSMHLFWRLRTSIPLSPADLEFLHPSYSLDEDSYDDIFSALSSELAMSRNLNLLRLRQAPDEFLRLFG